MAIPVPHIKTVKVPNLMLLFRMERTIWVRYSDLIAGFLMSKVKFLMAAKTAPMVEPVMMAQPMVWVAILERGR